MLKVTTESLRTADYRAADLFYATAADLFCRAGAFPRLRLLSLLFHCRRLSRYFGANDGDFATHLH